MRRHPDWLKVKLGSGQNFSSVKALLRDAKLHTICEEAKCPNIAECFGRGTAVFLILGTVCTRDCRYCYVCHGQPLPVDEDEPFHVAQSVKQLGLRYVVITSVTRDDLKDGGAKMFSATIRQIKTHVPECKIEVLIPDFQGNEQALQTVLAATPHVVNHNIEVVASLFPVMRPQGDYHRSLTLLKQIKKKSSGIKSKSGFMVGLGETDYEILQTMRDLYDAHVDFLTIGQYLQPSRHHAPIERYYTPEEFSHFKEIGESIGFKHVEAGPLVRSSYHADEALCVIDRLYEEETGHVGQNNLQSTKG
jgi:lipoic acid synthetase